MARRTTVMIGNRTYRRVIPSGEPVTDGTIRCIQCGQIDEPEYHDAVFCRSVGRSDPRDGSDGAE